MSEPSDDDVVEAVAQAIHAAGNCVCGKAGLAGDYPPLEVLHNRTLGQVAEAFLATPIVAEWRRKADAYDRLTAMTPFPEADPS